MAFVPDKFTGTHFQTLDDKGRVPIPAKLYAALRSRIRHEYRIIDPGAPDPSSMTVVLSISVNGLAGVYTEAGYEKMLEDIRKGNIAKVRDIDADSLIEDFENAKETQTLDKLNRFRVPPVLKDALEIQKEVAFLGSGDFIELNAREHHVAAVTERLKQLQRRRQGLLSQGNDPGKVTDGSAG